MTLEELEEEIAKKQRLAQLESLEANKFRAQSITVGTAGGGTAEITMRSNKGMFLWNTYQPVEVIELINQLAAGIGCHIQIMPRQDFASWRNWGPSDKALMNQGGNIRIGADWPPFPNQAPTSSDEQGEPSKIEVQEKENVATKKAVNKRSTKRARPSAK